jgi:hypothetical protein
LGKGSTGQDSGSHDTIDMFLDQSGFDVPLEIPFAWLIDYRISIK